MLSKIYTIGVYGFDEPGFFSTLTDAEVDVFCDVRQRRGVRGSEYAFVNSQRLQARLQKLGIRYLHLKDLAPSVEMRRNQHAADQALGIGKRSREALSPLFVKAYRDTYLSQWNIAEFMELLQDNAGSIALFCVEQDPSACHRSLVAERLGAELGVEVEHLRPWKSSS